MFSSFLVVVVVIVVWVDDLWQGVVVKCESVCVLVFAYPDHLFFILIYPLPVVMLKQLTVYIMITFFWSFACCYAKEINSIYDDY